MKTYETLDGKFVSENPGLENTVFGRDSRGTKIVYGTVMYAHHYKGTIHMNVVDANSVNYLCRYINTGYIAISYERAQQILKTTKCTVYGNIKYAKLKKI